MEALFILLLTMSICKGFLIDSSTPRTTNPGLMIDKHYYMLMDMITDESRARRQLQQFVVQLQHELTDSKAEIRVLKATVAMYNSDSKKLDHLYNQTEGIQIETEKLKRDYSTLQQNYNILQTENQNSQLEIQNLKHLKVVCDCISNKSATVYQNNTDNLSRTIQMINSKVNQLISDGNARKEDFLALYNKTLTSDRKVTELEVKIGRNLTTLMTRQNISSSEIYSLNKTDNTLKGDIVQLKEKQHLTELKMSFVESEVNSTIENVAVTSCAPHSIKYNSGEIIKFSDVKLSNGIGNIDKFRSSGTFTCEKQGLYLVGAYINSYSFGAQFKIVRNGNMISQVHFRPDSIPTGTSSLHTGTGVIAVLLNVKDTLNVKAGYPNMYVNGGYSCLTVIKVK
ncbi:uncharacterized protein LOC143043420 [Mytilus galloprovincialis]|uniref:uncharacterized protein LOC143043420 n=1 Tax=Mytilus galloprovincialis TaxID=29158 RepID=UPI003F7B7154